MDAICARDGLSCSEDHTACHTSHREMAWFDSLSERVSYGASS